MRNVIFGLVFALGLAFASSSLAQRLPGRQIDPNLTLRVQTASWSAWENAGGALASAPVCLSPTTNQIECFARGPSMQLHRTSWNGSQWRVWEALPGVTVSGEVSDGSGPSCLRDAAGVTHCFVRGAIGTNARQTAPLQHRWFPPGSAGWWEDLGGLISSVPSCTAALDSPSMWCFGVGAGGALFGRVFDGNVWGAWQNFGGAVRETTVPECVAHSRGRVDCVIVDAATNQFRHRVVAGSATQITAWQTISGNRFALFHNSAYNPQCQAVADSGVVCYALAQMGSQSDGPRIGVLRMTLPLTATSWGVSALSDNLSAVDFSCLNFDFNSYACFVLSTGSQFAMQEFYSSTAQWISVPLTAPTFSRSANRLDCVNIGGDRVGCMVGSAFGGPMAFTVRTPPAPLPTRVLSP